VGVEEVALGNVGPRCRLMILGDTQALREVLDDRRFRRAEGCIHLNNVMMFESDILWNSGGFG